MKKVQQEGGPESVEGAQNTGPETAPPPIAEVPQNTQPPTIEDPQNNQPPIADGQSSQVDLGPMSQYDDDDYVHPPAVRPPPIRPGMRSHVLKSTNTGLASCSQSPVIMPTLAPPIIKPTPPRAPFQPPRRGSPPPDAPTSQGVSSTTTAATSQGTRTRFMRFMPTPRVNPNHPSKN